MHWRIYWVFISLCVWQGETTIWSYHF